MKLLIVQSGFLGDVILSTATFDAARQLTQILIFPCLLLLRQEN